MIDCDVDALSGDIKAVLLYIAEDVLGRAKEKQQSWRIKEDLALWPKEDPEKQEKSFSEAAAEYRKVNNNIEKETKTAQKNWIKENAVRSMKGLHKNAVVRLAQDPQQEGQKRSSIIEDSAGHVLMEDKAVLVRWTEYCNDLYSFPMETTKHPLRRPASEQRPHTPSSPSRRGPIGQWILKGCAPLGVDCGRVVGMRQGKVRYSRVYERVLGNERGVIGVTRERVG